MGASRYVGRVGVLAVALGVGTAVVTGHGVARATPDPDSPNVSQDQLTPDTKNPAPDPVTPGTTSPAPGSTVTPPAGAGQTTPGTGSQSGTQTSASQSLNSSADSAATGQVVSTGGAQTEKPGENGLASLNATQVDLGSALPSGKSAVTSPYDSSSSVSRLTVNSFALSGGLGDGLVNTLNVPTAKLNAFAATQDAPIAMARTSTPTIDTPSVTTLDALAPTTVAPALTLRSVVGGILGLFGLGSLAATNAPVAPAQPTLMWGVLAWARREIEGLAGFFGGAAADKVEAVAPTSLALSAAPSTLAAAQPMALAAAAAAAAPGFPIPGAQLSPSTTFVNWLTGNYPVNNTLDRFGISGTDVGVMWDNGIWDDPTTPVHENEVLIAFGDTFGNRLVPGEEWRNNVLFRSYDKNLADGISVADGHYVGTAPESTDIWAGSPLDRTQWLNFQRTFSKQAVPNPNLGAATTIIPTAGISVPRAGAPFGVMQVISFMAVQQWGAPGSWTTSYSALATSLDNGESWQVAPQTVRYNQWWTGNQNFQQSAFVRPGDGFVYEYGTPNGRQGSAFVARVAEKDILDLTKYEYYSAAKPGWFGSTPAGWYKNNPGAATAIMPPAATAGACGAVSAGNTVSELSVQYNSYLKKYVALYTDQNNSVVMRTADQPQGTWSAAKVLLTQQPGGIYAPMMHPWSPSTLGSGTDLYWNLSLSSEYNVMLMKTDLTKV